MQRRRVPQASALIPTACDVPDLFTQWTLCYDRRTGNLIVVDREE